MTFQASRMLYTIYLPLNYNDGNLIPASRLDWARGEIARYAGGCTELPSGDGLWIDEEGRVYRDRVVPILVVAPDSSEAEWFFRRLARELAVLLAQQEIFIHRTPVSVVEALSLSAVTGPAERTPQPTNLRIGDGHRTAPITLYRK